MVCFSLRTNFLNTAGNVCESNLSRDDLYTWQWHVLLNHQCCGVVSWCTHKMSFIPLKVLSKYYWLDDYCYCFSSSFPMYFLFFSALHHLTIVHLYDLLSAIESVHEAMNWDTKFPLHDGKGGEKEKKKTDSDFGLELHRAIFRKEAISFVQSSCE